MKYVNAFFILALAINCSSPKAEESAVSKEASKELPPTFLTSFDYQPPLPVNGKLMGIIELGSSGFNSFIVNMDANDRWSLENETYGESYVAQDSITLEYVLSKINEYKKEMLGFGVRSHRINFVASSSAIRNESVKKIAARLRDYNIGIITVSAEQEGNYALFATIPKEFAKEAYMIDMGSGNTKVSWVSDEDTVTLETFGSKYYLEGITDNQAYYEMKRIIAQIPEKNKNLCFLVGGIPYRMAELTNNRSGRYTILEHPDNYEMADTKGQAGLNLYKAIYEESTYSYVFDWDSNFSIGVLMSVN